MLSIDLKNAIEDPKMDNFTALLFRLILKADGENMRKLALGYPVEVEMVKIFKTECPYVEPSDAPFTGVNWEEIERMARERVEGEQCEF